MKVIKVYSKLFGLILLLVSACTDVDDNQTNFIAEPDDTGETDNDTGETDNDNDDIDDSGDIEENDVCFDILGVDCNSFEEAYVKASNTEPEDHFGRSVALYRDTLAVGAPAEDSAAVAIDGEEVNNNAPNSGAVYLFERQPDGWTQKAYIKPSNTDAEDGFGEALALHGDTLVVGAPYEASMSTGVNEDQIDNSIDGSGAVYVFSKEDDVWSQTAYLKALNANENDNFGISVDVYRNTIAVGATGEDSAFQGVNTNSADNSNPNAGAVYIFAKNDGEWEQQAYIKPATVDSNDQFGSSIAISEDTLVVGAPNEDSSATGSNRDDINDGAQASGAAYVFIRDDDEWTQQAYIKASNTDPNDQFGNSVAIYEDTIAIGAYRESSKAVGINGDQTDNSSASSGAVYVFTRNEAVWTQQAYIKASTSSVANFFGWDLELDGDHLAIGASGEEVLGQGLNGVLTESSTVGTGAVYLFVRDGGLWNEVAHITASNGDLDDGFGNVISLDNGRIAIGAFQEDSSAVGINGDETDNLIQDSGAVYVRKISPDEDVD